jgi:hypothetical protein
VRQRRADDDLLQKVEPILAEEQLYPYGEPILICRS